MHCRHGPGSVFVCVGVWAECGPIIPGLTRHIPLPLSLSLPLTVPVYTVSNDCLHKRQTIRFQETMCCEAVFVPMLAGRKAVNTERVCVWDSGPLYRNVT